MRSVRLLRLLLGANATEIARGAGICARELRRIDRGVVQPTGRTLAGLDDAFGVVMAELLAAITSKAASRSEPT